MSVPNDDYLIRLKQTNDDEGHSEFERSFRDWLADRLSDFSQALKNGLDPEVTFSAQIKGMPKVLCQIRLIDLQGVFTREDFPIDVIEEGRN